MWKIFTLSDSAMNQCSLS